MAKAKTKSKAKAKSKTSSKKSTKKAAPKQPAKKESAKPKPVSRELTRAEKGLSIVGLLKNTPPYVKLTARDMVTLKKMSRANTKGGHPAIKGVCVSNKGEGSGRPHKCSVIGLDKEKPTISKQKRVIVSCDCEFFLFYCEYALTTWGAARIKYSNGEPADVRNPANVPLLCKHLVKLTRAVKEHNY